MKNDDITRSSLEEVKAAIAVGTSRSDWAKTDALSEAALDAAIAADPDEGPDHLAIDWDAAEIGLPAPKQMVNMRLDADVLAWFRGSGRGYQTRINAVLRSYVAHARREKHDPAAGPAQ